MNEKEHASHLKYIFHTLTNRQLFVNFSKCEFVLKYVSSLGHIVSNEGSEGILIK